MWCRDCSVSLRLDCPVDVRKGSLGHSMDQPLTSVPFATSALLSFSLQIVAVVVKYADNVLKGFATSLSILISSLVSWYMFFDLDINAGFIFGACIVLASVYYYGYTPPQKAVVHAHAEEDEQQQLLTA